MTITRAQALTGSLKKTESFSDFVTSFAKTPYGNQLGKVINENSVNQALKNLILTNLGERPFQPTIGSDITRMLFELNTSAALELLELHVQNAILNNEPRVNLIDIGISSSVDEYTIEITITYNLINNPAPVSFTLLLKRIR